jgi:chromosomal replication initiator protein
MKNHLNVWDNCLTIIKDNVSAQSYNTWFTPIKPLMLKGSVLTIQVPSNFFFEWLEEHYIDLIKKAIKRELGNDGLLEYSIQMENKSNTQKKVTMNVPTSSNKKATSNPAMSMPVDIAPIKNPFVIPGLRKINVESNLIANYSFDNFIEGDCNRLARSAGYAVAKNPGGTAFNPLLLYGKTGVGKSHLAHAIGLEIKKNHPEKTVLYLPSEKFTTKFIESVRSNTVNDFSHFFQMIDVLIIDDVHFFSGKTRTQDVFFHIFNHLHQTNKQIILTSDKAPVELEGMEQRLLSRFKWGLSADLQAPGLDTRINILNKKMHSDGIEMPKEVIEYLAYSITVNVRELEGAFISLIAQSSLNKKSITLDLAKQMIDKFVKNTTREVSIDFIQKVVCDYFDMQVETLKSKTRKREVVQARQIAMFFSKKLTKSSLATIGMHCGGKDHATVLHACRTVNNLADTDKSFKRYIEDLDKKLALN